MRSSARLLLVLLAASFVTGLVVAPAGGAPIDDKRAQAKALAAEIDANAEKLSALNESIKGAQIKLAEANATIEDARVRIELARAVTRRLEDLVRSRAASVYRSSGAGGAIAAVITLDVRELATREQYASAATRRDDTVMEDLAIAREELAQRRRDAEQAANAAAEEQRALEAARSQFQSADAQRQQLLAKVQGEIKTLVAEEEARRLAAQAPKPVLTVTAGGTPTKVAFDPGKLPAASGKAGTAVAYVKSQLGKPYCYAGVGPDCFDCSGLTMMAWKQAGVTMGHNSEVQYSSFPKVPLGSLQPGDIVWHPGHVGLYVGSGAVIHAPHTGDVVRYHDVGYYQGAVRPG